MLVASRAFQGIFAAFISPVARILIIKLFTDRAQVFAKLSSIILLGPLLGPLIGGAITTWLTWRFIFFVNIPIGIAILWIISTRFPTIASNVAGRFDTRGFILLALALLTTLFTIDTLTDANIAADFKFISIGLSILLFFLYYLHNKNIQHPIINLAVFKNRIYRFFSILLTSIRLLAMNMGFIGPLYVQTQLHYSAIQSGLTIAPAMIGALLASRSIHLLLRKFNGRMLYISLFAIVIATQLLIAYCMLHFNLYLFLGTLLVTGWATTALMAINGQHLYHDLDKTLQSAGALISSAIIQLGRGFAIALIALVLIVSSGHYTLDWQTALPKLSYAIVMWISAGLLFVSALSLRWMPIISTTTIKK